MTAIRALAAALIATGGVLLYAAHTIAKGFQNTASEILFGQQTRDVTLFNVTGGAAIVIGVVAMFIGGKRR